MAHSARRARYDDVLSMMQSKSAAVRLAARRHRGGRFDSFRSEGVVAHLDQWGVERFNFPQQVWVYPHVRMGSIGTAPSEVLAVNILSRLIPARQVSVYIGVTARRALQLAPAFVEECLAGIEPRWTQYTIPIAALRAWLAMHR